MKPENKELENIKTILDELIELRKAPDLSEINVMYLDSRISMRSEQLLRGNV